jgi:phosphonate transport system substrate-binding protein
MSSFIYHYKNHKLKSHIGYLFFTAIFVFNIITAHTQDLRIATYRYADNDRIKNIQPLALYLEQQLGIKAEIKSYPTVLELVNAIQNDKADIAFINTFGYLLFTASQKEINMHPALTFYLNPEYENNYRSAIVAADSSPINSTGDIIKYASRTRLMLVDKGSTSGNLIPRLALATAGIDRPEKKFRSVSYGISHAATLESLLNNNADLAAMGYAEYEKILKQDSAAIRKQLKLLWTSTAIPMGPVLFSNRFGSAFGGTLQKLLLNLHDASPSVFLAIKNGWSEFRNATNFISIADSYYDAFRNEMGKKKKWLPVLKEFSK